MQNYSGGDPRQSDVKRGNDAQHTDAALPVTKRGRHALPTDKALYDAAFHNDVPKLKALLERFHEDAAKRKLYALDINEEKPSLMHAAAEGGSVDVAIYLNQRDSELTQARLAESNVTPLYTAMMNNQKWFVVWLLKNDARCANESWGSQLTPLLWAIINGRVDYVKFLLRSKANVVYSPMEGYPQPLFVALSTRAYYTSYEAGLQFQKIPENSEEIAEAFIEALTTKKQLSRTSGLMDAENPELFNLFQKTKESDQLQQVFEEIFNVADQDVLMALFRLGVKHDCFFERGQCSVIEMAERCGMFEFADHYSKEKVLSGRVIECAIRRTDAFFTEVELNNEVRRVLSDNKESQVIKLWTDDDLNDKKRIIEYELGHYARFLGRSVKE
ncbi:MAG: ankyrin repeat domain-containing protein [Pseudomonadota bacterium]